MSDGPSYLSGSEIAKKIARQIERCNRIIEDAAKRQAFDGMDAKCSIRFHKAASQFDFFAGHIPTVDELRQQD